MSNENKFPSKISQTPLFDGERGDVCDAQRQRRERDERKEKYEDVLALMTKSMYPLGWSSLACFPY